MVVFAWIAAALAGTVYLNEVPVPAEVLSSLELQQVDLRVDPDGDVHIRAPGFAWQDGRLVTTAASTAMRPRDGWWLILEDLRSSGLTVEVRLNGQLIKQLHSGEPNRLIPIGAWVRPGTNDLRVDVVGQGATGGRLAVVAARGHADGPLLVVEGTPTRWVVGADTVGRPLAVSFDTSR